MKKIIAMLILIIPLLTFGGNGEYNMKNFEYSMELSKKNKSGGDYYDINPGVPLLLGGVAFLTAGLLTPTDDYWTGTSWEPKPFYQQGPKLSATISGVALIIPGIVITINN